MATVLKRAKDTKNALEDWMNQKPQSNSSAYDSALNAALDALTGSSSFSSGYTSGTDQNAQNYLSGYRAAVNQAAADSAAQTRALSGGYGANYADSAAAQAAQLQSQGARLAEPMLRALASSAYNANTASDQAAAAGMLTGQQLENSADQLNYQNWAAMRDVLAGQEQQAAAESDDFWNKVLDGVLWLAQTGLNAYDAYKGFTQQQWENEFALQQWEAQQAQQQLENERYATEYADSRADAAWQQGITEQQLEASMTAAGDEHALSQAQLALLQKELASGGSSGSKSGGAALLGGLTVSEWLRAADALDSALYNESALAPYYAQLLGIDPELLTGTGEEEEEQQEESASYAQRAAARETPVASAFGESVAPYMGLMDPQYLELLLGSGSAEAQQAAGYAQTLRSQGMGLAAIRSRLIQMGYTEAQAQAILNSLG